MDKWVQIISKQWYRTLSTNEITWFCFELNKLQRVYVISSYYGECFVWYYVIGPAFIVSTFTWISLARVLKNVIDTMEIWSRLYYYVHLLIAHYLLQNWQIMLMPVIKKTVFILHDSFFLNVRIHISQISTVRTRIWAYHPKQYATTWIQIRSWIILSMFFSYILGFYSVSSCLRKFYAYFEYKKVLGFTVSWLPIESNQLQQEYYFLPNNEPNLKYCLEKYFENSIY